MSISKGMPSIGRIARVGGVQEGAREGAGAVATHEAKPMAEQGALGSIKSFRQTRRQQGADRQDPVAQACGAERIASLPGPEDVGASAQTDPGMLDPGIGADGLDPHQLKMMFDHLRAINETGHQIVRDAAKSV